MSDDPADMTPLASKTRKRKAKKKPAPKHDAAGDAKEATSLLARLMKKRDKILQDIQSETQPSRPSRGSKDPAMRPSSWVEDDDEILAATAEPDDQDAIAGLGPRARDGLGTLPMLPPPGVPPTGNGHRPHRDDRDDGYVPSTTSQARTQSTLAELAAQVFKEKQLADSLLDAEDIELKTRLNPQLITAIATALLVAQQHGCPELAAYAYKIMELRVSLLGEGRKEVVEVTKGSGSMGMHPDMVNRMRG